MRFRHVCVYLFFVDILIQPVMIFYSISFEEYLKKNHTWKYFLKIDETKNLINHGGNFNTNCRLHRIQGDKTHMSK